MPIPGSLPKQPRALVREEVYATVLEWILDGTLYPGEYVREQELAEALGVSRTPVREALRRLEDSGLVRSEANRSTRVAPLEISDVKMIYPIIGTLEPLAIRLSEGQMTLDDIDEIAAANAQIVIAVQEGIRGGAADADERFHQLVSSHCGNPELIRIVGGLRVKLRRMAHAYFLGRIIAEVSVEEHAAVVEALRAGDVERAAVASAAHWQGSLDRFLEHTSVPR